MSAAAVVSLTDEQTRLLRIGAESLHGFLCVPYEAQGRMYAVFNDMAHKGLVVWIDRRPVITTTGHDYVKSLEPVLRTPRPEPVGDHLSEALMARHRAPQDFSRRRNEKIVLALVSVPEGEAALSFRASTDGDDSKAVVFPRSAIEIVARDGRFIVAIMKGWVALDRKITQGNIPVLTKSVRWSPDERAAWSRIKSHLVRTRDNLKRQHKGYAPSPARMPYGYTA